jgi:hypothetical protein
LPLVSQHSGGSRQKEYEVERPIQQGAIRIRRHDEVLACDVIVNLGGREMVVALPDYERALRWARMEAKAYKIADNFSEE